MSHGHANTHAHTRVHTHATSYKLKHLAEMTIVSEIKREKERMI